MKRIFVASLGLAVPLLAMVVPAAAGPRDDVLYGVSRCGGIADDRTWLDCVYGAAQPMRAAQLGLPPAPAAQQKLVPPAMSGMAAPSFGGGAAVAAAPVYRPGFFSRLLSEQDIKDEPPTSLRSYKFDGAGFFTVTLANGETWKQDGADTAQARWNKPAQTYGAQIVAVSTSGPSGMVVQGVRYQVNKQR